MTSTSFLTEVAPPVASEYDVVLLSSMSRPFQLDDLAAVLADVTN